MARQTSTIHNKTANNCVTSNDGFWRKAVVDRNANGNEVPRPLLGMIIIGANEPVAVFSVRL
jgi:hypothetical protein